MQIQSIQQQEARCQVRGVERTVSLRLLEDAMPQAGDWVLVHVGCAIQLLCHEEAAETWDLLDEWIEHENTVL